MGRYTIPQALEAIYKQGGAEVLVINVFDPEKHRADVPGELVTFSAKDEAAPAHAGVLSVAAVKSEDGATTYAVDADYTFSKGVLARVSGRLPAGCQGWFVAMDR